MSSHELGLEVERGLIARALRRELGRQEIVDERQREVARGLADALLLVLEDHVVVAGRAFAAGLAEDGVRSGELLQLDGDVLEHVAEPGAAVLGEAAHEAAFGLERALVRAQARQRGEEPVREAGDLRARPALELAEIDGEPHHGEVRVQAGAAIDAALEELHESFLGVLGGGRATGFEIERSAVDEDVQAHVRHADGLALLRLGDRGVRELRRIDDGDRARPHDGDLLRVVDEGGGVLVEADAHRERVVRERGEQAAEAIALAEVLIDHDAVREPEAGHERDAAGVRRVAFVP